MNHEDHSELEILATLLAETLIEEKSTHENLTAFRKLLIQFYLQNAKDVPALEAFASRHYEKQIWVRVRATQAISHESH